MSPHGAASARIDRPITSHLLGVDQLLAIAIPRTGSGFKGFSFQITRVAELSKEVTSVRDIDPGGTVAPDKLGEDGHGDQTSSPGDSVYRLDKESDPNRIYHIAQLWQPNDLQIYWQNPSDQLSQGFTRSTSVTVSDTEGWTVWSDNTVFTDKVPSTALESVILPGVTPFIGFQNKSATVSKPTALLTGRAYEVTPLNAKDVRTARRVLSGNGFTRTLIQLGGERPFDIATPDSWGDALKLDEEELFQLLKRRDRGSRRS